MNDQEHTQYLSQPKNEMDEVKIPPKNPNLQHVPPDGGPRVRT